MVEGIENSNIDYPKKVNDLKEARKIAQSMLSSLYQQGYLAASIDSIVHVDNEIRLLVAEGSKYKWVQLKKGNLSEEEIQNIDLSNRLFLNRPFSPKNLSALYDRVVDYFENNGYPFASVQLDSLTIDNEQQLSASLSVDRGAFYAIDSIKIMGDEKSTERYLLRHLMLKEGNPYNEKSFSSISKKISEIPFIEETQAHELQFFESGLKLLLYPKKKKTSRFDGIVGLLTDEGDGSIELTGDVDLNLVNSFNRGENIRFNWRKLKGNQQDLNINLLYPYFLNSNFGLDVNFKLFKRDTTFIDLQSRLGINYRLAPGQELRMYYSNKSSRLLSRGRFLNNQLSSIPNLGDININAFGVGYRTINFDYLFNPRQGKSINIEFSAGQKRLQKIASLEETNPSIYQDVQLKTNQFDGMLELEYFIPVKQRSTIKFGNQSASTFSENLYQNELLRIGGLKKLRGFDEESINASTYSIFTLEYRFLLDRNSYLSLFTDAAFYEQNTLNGYDSDNPLGFGAGINFETNAGVFAFNYAIGKQRGNAIQFRAAKIHFGFINFF
ncbi:MAG: hypothetical protein CMO34_05020 [Verrucomicrobia bacterium]|nr:hypothetical protein [Verrucomicrobiota bacterium]